MQSTPSHLGQRWPDGKTWTELFFVSSVPGVSILSFPAISIKNNRTILPTQTDHPRCADPRALARQELFINVEEPAVIRRETFLRQIIATYFRWIADQFNGWLQAAGSHMPAGSLDCPLQRAGTLQPGEQGQQNRFQSNHCRHRLWVTTGTPKISANPHRVAGAALHGINGIDKE